MNILNNIDLLYKKFGSRLSTKNKWIIAYWQKIDKVEIKDGMMSVNDVIKATNPVDIINGLELYIVLKKNG